MIHVPGSRNPRTATNTMHKHWISISILLCEVYVFWMWCRDDVWNIQDLSMSVRWLAFLYMLFAVVNVGLMFESRSVLSGRSPPRILHMICFTVWRNIIIIIIILIVHYSDNKNQTGDTWWTGPTKLIMNIHSDLSTNYTQMSHTFN